MPNNEAYAKLIGEDGKQVDASRVNHYLDNVIKEFSSKVLRVGVTDPSQVEKAKLHEFGSRQKIEFEEEGKKYNIKGVPTRSFIRMPLKLFLPSLIEQNSESIKRFRSPKAVENLMSMVGDSCIEVIHEAFDTQGFGQWIEHQSESYKKDNDNPVLDRTGQLKNSIGYEIVDKETI